MLNLDELNGENEGLRGQCNVGEKQTGWWIAGYEDHWY